MPCLKTGSGVITPEPQGLEALRLSLASREGRLAPFRDALRSNHHCVRPCLGTVNKRGEESAQKSKFIQLDVEASVSQPHFSMRAPIAFSVTTCWLWLCYRSPKAAPQTGPWPSLRKVHSRDNLKEMVSTGDTLTIVFGIVATITAVVAILVARRQNTTRTELDTELGLMGSSTTNTIPSARNQQDSDEDEPHTGHGRCTDQESQAHQVIGDILELVSRHLRGRH
ncbi:hypothetical protein BDZ45DRAFT_804030, partial [Acephala macrosclerotiorum]